MREAHPGDTVFTADLPLVYYLHRLDPGLDIRTTADLGGDEAAADARIRTHAFPRAYVVRRDSVAEIPVHRLNQVEASLASQGYRIVERRAFGRQPDALQAVRDRVAGRHLDDYAVRVVVYERS